MYVFLIYLYPFMDHLYFVGVKRKENLSLFHLLTRSLREPGGPCTNSMEVSESRMKRVKGYQSIHVPNLMVMLFRTHASQIIAMLLKMCREEQLGLSPH